MTVSVREAATEDHSVLRRVIVASYAEFRTSLSPQAWRSYLRDLKDVEGRARAGSVLIAAEGEAVVGTVTYLPPGAHATPLAPPGYALVRVLAVLPSGRRRGIARILSSSCIGRARTAGCRGIALQTATLMTAARALYTSMEFQLVGSSETPIGVTLETYLLGLDVYPRPVGVRPEGVAASTTRAPGRQ